VRPTPIGDPRPTIVGLVLPTDGNRQPESERPTCELIIARWRQPPPCLRNPGPGQPPEVT
jgi:hypothetical protein